jgi:hypothetical protein
MICRLAQSPDLLQDDISFLEGLGWDFSNPLGRRNVVLSPWGVLKSPSKLADLQLDFDYFRNHREAVSFILKTGSCRTRVSHAHNSNLSICSPSVNSKDEDVKEVKSTGKSKRTNPLGRPLADTRRHLNSLELEIIPNKNFEYSFNGDDLCPFLSGVGLEGQLKFALNSSADSNSYCFSRIRSVLSALGWNFHFLHQGSSVNLAPWADLKNPFLFRVGVDYFFNSRDICEYLIKHGHKPIAEEPSRHRHSTSVVAAKKKIRKATRKESKSKPSQEVKTNHHLRIDPLPYVTVDDVTLSPMPSLEKEMDTRCSPEIKILLKRARSPPKLNLSEFEQVWDVLCDNSWSAEYEEEEGTTYHRLSNGGVKTHSFANKDEVLDFIRIQLLSRGQDYQKLVDRACFCPETSFSDEEDDDSAELPEEEISEDECDLNDVSEMNISTSLLDDIKSYLEQHDNDTPSSSSSTHSPIAPTNGLKRKCLFSNENDNETVGNGGGATLLQELDAEIATKRVRWEQAADQRDKEVKGRNELHIEERKVEKAEFPHSLLVGIECAKLNLAPSYFPAFPLGREQEYRQILQHLDHMSQSNSGSLRVSGLHGQGKTITTHIAMERFQDSHHQHKIVWLSAPMISTFQDVINGLAVALGMGTISNRSGFGQTILLQQILQSNQGILLVIDEIDILQTRIRDLLLSMANTANSKLLFIGIENVVNPGTFQHCVSFPAYDDSSLSRILDSLTENLFDEKSLKLVSKIFATDGASSSLHLSSSGSPHSSRSTGDVRPMKVFALKCLELAVVNLTTADLDSPVRPIVDMKIVSQCRKDVTPTMTSVLVSFHKNSLHILVSLVCSYRPGQLFSLVDMQSAVNTFYLKRCMEVINLDTVVLYAESLLQDGLLSVDRDKKKKQFSSLNQYLQVAQVSLRPSSSMLFFIFFLTGSLLFHWT